MVGGEVEETGGAVEDDKRFPPCTPRGTPRGDLPGYLQGYPPRYQVALGSDLGF